MKAFFKHQPLTNKPPCDELSSLSSLLRRLSSLLSLVKRSLFNLLARVSTGMNASRLASSSNKRLYVGIALIMCGPLFENLYRCLEWAIDPAAYRDPYYYFHAVRGNMSAILYVLGFFVAVPIESRWKYIAIVPLTYNAARIIWMAFVTSNEQYHSFMEYSLLLWVGSCVVAVMVIFNSLMARHYHKILGALARLKGLRDCPDMPDSQKVQLMGRAAEELEAALKN